MSPAVHFSANMCMTNRVSHADMSMFCWLFPLIIPIVSILFMIKSQLFYDWTPIKWPISRHSITWMHLSTDLSVVNSPMRLTQREVQKGRQLCPFYYGWLVSGFLMGIYPFWQKQKWWLNGLGNSPSGTSSSVCCLFSASIAALILAWQHHHKALFVEAKPWFWGYVLWDTDSCFTREPANTATSCRLLLIFLSFLSFYGFFDSFLHKKVW